ncbi:aminotransferase class I/II-fold pyridoxal phosphate-dependent enzyme [Bacillus sp. SD088]|uniref:aminotransferase class I/II-fold pyridoxal phosphate-dependent enzyme n=1 Tax=Bacillus sp. SD088 TaxID=2782012 RepID=UPI001F614ADD|nr:aminotransferase class I/II-fold pyridoxal phosphate-dependent enzyme [Bacillus sp. SD088]
MIQSKVSERIFLSPPHLSGKELGYIQEAITSNWIAPLGPNVDAFEKEMAQYLDVKGAVAVSSGTAAIHLALALLEVERGDTVFCSSLTFVASANPILYQGAQPIFIDSEPESWNMSPHALRVAFEQASHTGKLPKAVIVVNLYGQNAKMDEITSICQEYEVPMIEDAAESLGSSYRGKPSGTFGKFGIFSFNGNKIITTSGGGMLVSNDLAALKKARYLAAQARDPALHYQHSKVGYNYRMSNILAGIGLAQMEVLEERIQAKRWVFSRYEQELSKMPGIQLMPELAYSRSNRWLTTFTVNEKETGIASKALLLSLARENIEARPVWKPLHLQPLFEGVPYYPHQNLSVSEQLFLTGICLPSGTNLSEEEIRRVVNCLNYTLKHA